VVCRDAQTLPVPAHNSATDHYVVAAERTNGLGDQVVHMVGTTRPPCTATGYPRLKFADQLLDSMTPPRRPGPARWLLYAFGRGLPQEYREWVLHDVTTRTWVLRHLVRTTVQLTPVAVLLYALIPGPAWIRALAVLGGLLLGFFYSVAYMYETTENRVIKAGYPRGTAEETRDRHSAIPREEQARRYNERYRNPPPTDE
jgi:Family of unknown function (DUF5313)